MSSATGLIRWSDHALVSAKIPEQVNQTPSAPWHLNNSILHKKDYNGMTEQLVREYFVQNNYNISILRTHKAVIKGHFIQFTTVEKKTLEKKIKNK